MLLDNMYLVLYTLYDVTKVIDGGGQFYTERPSYDLGGVDKVGEGVG